MTTKEFYDVCAAVSARTEAWVGEGDYVIFAEGDVAQFSVFAGTDLPAALVMTQLQHNAELHEHTVEEHGAVSALKSMALLGFLFGFECGRRST